MSTEAPEKTEAPKTGKRAAEAAKDAVNPPATADGAAKPATPTATRTKAPDTSTVKIDDINSATLAVAELITASKPVRERNEQQKAMDEVAARAYAAWVKAGRPTTWEKMPVVTYFLAPEDVAKYKYLIRRACHAVTPDGDASGVRDRIGNEFTLSEKMAAKLTDKDHPNGRPELAGKTVLAWTATDKRPVAAEGNKPAAKPDDKPKS